MLAEARGAVVKAQQLRPSDPEAVVLHVRYPCASFHTRTHKHARTHSRAAQRDIASHGFRLSSLHPQAKILVEMHDHSSASHELSQFITKYGPTAAVLHLLG